MADTIVRTYNIKTETDQRIQLLGDQEKRRWAGIIIDKAIQLLWEKEHPETPEPISLREEMDRL